MRSDFEGLGPWALDLGPWALGLRPWALGLGAALALAVVGPAAAHSGPPYPVVSNQTIGAYRISVWTDPDTTDDRTPGGQFWITIEPARQGAALPPGTRARVTIRALDSTASPGTPPEDAEAMPVDGDVSRQYAGLVMDREGPFAVQVTLQGPWGRADVEAQVQATYDLRPARPLLLLYLVPFLLVGFLWTKLLLRRRRGKALARTPGLGP
jgi:hypothetical protein